MSPHAMKLYTIGSSDTSKQLQGHCLHLSQWEASCAHIFRMHHVYIHSLISIALVLFYTTLCCTLTLYRELVCVVSIIHLHTCLVHIQ